MNTIEIDFDVYEELLDHRYNEVYDSWGSELSDELYPLLKETLKECPPSPENTDPKNIIDNFLVNGELISRDDFTEDGQHSYYWQQYNGDWDKLREDALFSNEKAACMRF